MDSNLLKEAIADAKAVRQTALANAKVALEEAFSERYHAMFAEKLKEDAAMDETQPAAADGMKAEENVSEQEIDELIKELEAEVGGEPAAEPVAPEADASMAGAVPPAVGAPGMSGMPGVPGAVPPGCPLPMPAAPGVAPVPPMPPVAPPVPGAVPPVAPPSEVPPVSGEEADEDVDLNELLESLKEEIEKEGYEQEEGKKLDEMKKLDSSAIAPGGNKKPSAVASSSSDIESGGMKSHGVPGGEQTSGEDPTDVTKPDKNFDGNKKGNLAKAKPLKEDIKTHGVPGGEQTSGEDPTDVTKPDHNFDGNKGGDMAKTPHIVKENEALKKQLSEAYETITYVKGQLNEINLLNAKLLYTNKLFKEYNMNNEQKMCVVEMFDLSKTVREVKMTYANIAESLNFSGNDMRKRVTNTNTSVQSITEGLASKPVGGTKPKEIISEGKFTSRMKQLAGIRSEPTKK